MGRRKGQKVHKNHGLSKRCDCPRKRWSGCEHPWHFNFRTHRFNLNERAGLPVGRPLSRTEAETLRDDFKKAIKQGTFDAPPPEASTETSKAGDALTVREAGAKLVDDYREDPNRRAHRIPILEKALGTIYRTVVEDTPFGDWLLTDVLTSTLLAYRKARRRILRERERAQAERRDRIAKGEATPADLKATTELPRKKRGEVGINRQMELLRGLFNFAIQHGLLRQESRSVSTGRPS